MGALSSAVAGANRITRGKEAIDMANQAGTILKRIEVEEIEWVDLRFTDPKGKWQNLTMAW